MPFYTKKIDEVLLTLGTNKEGLKSDEAHQRTIKLGQNTLPKEQAKTLFAHFLRQFKSPIIYILLIEAVKAKRVQEISSYC